MSDKPIENTRAFIEVLAGEEPRLKVVRTVLTTGIPAVVLIIEYPSAGALTVPLTPTTARQVAATLVEYATELERGRRAQN